MAGSTQRVLVLGEDTRSFLTIVRSLGRFGLEVHVAWCPPNAVAAHSRYIHRIHCLPAYVRDDCRWLDALEELLRCERFDLVLPCHDAATLLLQTNRRRIEPAGRIYLLDDKAFEISFSKENTYRLAERLGIEVPLQRNISSAAELLALAREWRFPLVLKPRSSAVLANPFSTRAVRKIWSDGEIETAAASLAEEQGMLVQKNFLGKGVGVEVLCREGEILTAFQHERLHERPMGGGGSYRRSVPLDPRLVAASEKLMGAMRYTGVAMVEFKLEAQTGAWALMEINGRFWGSLPLAVAAGIDFPRFLYELLVFGRNDFPRRYRTNIYCRNWAMDVHWFRANLKADRRDAALMTVPLAKVAGEIFNILSLRERSDTFVLDDPKPAVRELAEAFGPPLNRALRRLSPVRAAMRRSAMRAALGSQSVLFVCRGNICRSPFAEKVLQRLRPAKRVSSAGLFPAIGRSSPPPAIAAAEQFAIDLRSHRSSFLTAEQLTAADVVFFFDGSQRAFVSANFPEQMHKMHYLGALMAAGDLEIADPFGGDVQAFEETYRTIQRLLTIL